MVKDHGYRIVIAQTSVMLINQTYKDIHEHDLHVKVTRITHETHQEPVKAIKAHFEKKRIADEGEIVLISHTGLVMCSHFRNQQDWSLYIDETLPVHDCIRTDMIPQYLRDALRVIPFDAEYSIVRPANKSRLKAITKAKPDDDHYMFRDLAQAVLSPKHDVFVKSNNYAGRNDHLAWFKALRPDAVKGWLSVTVMSALMSHTMMHHMWDDRVRWIEDKAITKRLRYREHRNGSLLTILYASSHDWSKRFRDSDIDGDTTPMVQIINATTRVFKGMEYGVHLNKDIEDIVVDMPGARLIPQVAHGLNEFQGLHGYMCAAALNLPPDHHAWLESRGLARAQIRTGVFLMPLYQSLMRISLRNPDDLTPVTCILPDKGSAEFIASFFVNSTIALLDTDVALPMASGKGGRPRVHLDGSAKAVADAAHGRLSRAAAKQQLLNEIYALAGAQKCDAKPNHIFSGFASQNSAPVSSEEPNADLAGGAAPTQQACAPMVGFSIFKSKYDLIASDVLPYSDPDEFIQGLHSYATRVLPRKGVNMLISPSVFDPGKVEETSKGRANVIYAAGIWLDFDGGDLSHESFAEIFPHWRVLAYSTYSSTKAVPRYRIFLPTSHVMSVQVYMHVTAVIVKALEHAGYRDREYLRKKPNASYKNHGLDGSKIAPENLMYLPCMPEDKGGYIWEDYREGRNPIPVLDLIANSTIIAADDAQKALAAPLPRISTPEINKAASVSMQALQRKLIEMNSKPAIKARQAYIDAAVTEWRTCNAGQSNAAFFRLAGALIRADVRWKELSTILYDEAAYCKSTSERRRDIPRMLKFLRARV